MDHHRYESDLKKKQSASDASCEEDSVDDASPTEEDVPPPKKTLKLPTGPSYKASRGSPAPPNSESIIQ